ncbi:hypothetical protein RFI_06273, partial [Reticulomyxa filosa]
TGPQQAKKKSQFIFADCAGYTTMDRKQRKADEKKDNYDMRYLSNAFFNLGALLTAVPKKRKTDEQSASSAANGGVEWKQSLLTQALHPIGTWLEQPNSPAPTDGPQVVLIVTCSFEEKFYDETLATLRFGNFPLVDPMLLVIVDKYQREITKLQALKLDKADSNATMDPTFEQVLY